MATSELNRVPNIPKDLLEYLDKHYPEASPLPGEDREQMMFTAGKRDLVRWLWVQHYRQENQNEMAGLEDIKLTR